jgi:hypothetical protein
MASFSHMGQFAVHKVKQAPPSLRPRNIKFPTGKCFYYIIWVFTHMVAPPQGLLPTVVRQYFHSSNTVSCCIVFPSICYHFILKFSFLFSISI